MTTECCLYQGKVVNYFIPSHSGVQVKNTENGKTQIMEIEPKEKVHCPRKYEVSQRKYLFTVFCCSSYNPHIEISCHCYK